MWSDLLEHYQKKSCLVDSNHWPTPWATYNSMLSAYHASRGSFNLHFSLLPWFASFLREKKNLFQKQSRPFPVEYGRVVISNFGMINQRNPILYSAFTVWFEWQKTKNVFERWLLLLFQQRMHMINRKTRFVANVFLLVMWKMRCLSRS